MTQETWPVADVACPRCGKYEDHDTKVKVYSKGVHYPDVVIYACGLVRCEVGPDGLPVDAHGTGERVIERFRDGSENELE